MDLLDKLETKLGDKFTPLNSNTDGIIVMIDDDERTVRLFKHICDEWCYRTRMGLSFDEIDENCYVSKDVNNYVFKFTNGSLERKGKYVKESNPLDNNLSILNEAMVKYITEGIPVEDTINNCNEMIKFQNVYRLSGSFKAAWHNGEYLTNKTYRIFASIDSKDTYLGKCEDFGSKVNRFADTPDHCFILNSDIHDIPMSIKLDKKWYIDIHRHGDALRALRFCGL